MSLLGVRHECGEHGVCGDPPLGQLAPGFGTFGTLRKHFLRNLKNQKRVGNVIHRSKMLSQPSVLLRTPSNSNQGVHRYNNSRSH